MSKVEICFDGASRNNPGPAGAGGVIKKDGKLVKKYYRYLGEKTNNQAECLAALLGLKLVKRMDLDCKRLVFIGDSDLIIKQLAGEYKIKSDNLKRLYWKIREELASMGCSAEFEHVKRNNNKTADKLANKGIDEYEKKNKGKGNSKKQERENN